MIENGANIGTKGIIWATFGGELLDVFYDLRWAFCLMVMLILADLWFGCCHSAHNRKHARTKKEREKNKFHFSAAGRRTLSKTIDYLTYAVVSAIIGLAVTEPLGIATHETTSAIGVGFGCLFELSSIVGHILALHHLRLKINWRKFVFGIVKTRSEEIGEVLNDSVEVEREEQ